MKAFVVVACVWCVCALCLAAYALGYQLELERSWQAYADEYVGGGK